MTILELLDELHTRGVVLERNGERLHVDAPTGAVTAPLREAMAEHKEELLAYIDLADYDTRPDLASDSLLWRRLLQMAASDDHLAEGLFGVLRGFRAMGARLAPSDRGYQIEPGEIDPTEYAAWRVTYLMPHRVTLTEYLNALAGEREVA
ncbi:MAG: hypothetical protein U0822_22125 [Anaerolineae bacterium]